MIRNIICTTTKATQSKNETKTIYTKSEVGIPQFEAQSASCATSARAQVAKRFNKLFLAIAQVALRFKEKKSFLRFIALRTEKIYISVRIIAL